jgi:hypothetical protein
MLADSDEAVSDEEDKGKAGRTFGWRALDRWSIYFGALGRLSRLAKRR